MIDYFLVHYDGDFQIYDVIPEKGESVDEAMNQVIADEGLDNLYDPAVGALLLIEVRQNFLSGHSEIDLSNVKMREGK